MASSDPMRVIGISYQASGATDVTLLSTRGVSVKLFDGARVTGFLFRDKNDPVEQCLSGLNVRGIVYEEEDRARESILNADKIAGIVYQEGPDLSYQIPSGSKITGVTYQESEGAPLRLLSGIQLNAGIINGARITGLAYLDDDSITVKSLRDATLTGVLFREREAEKEDVASGVRLIGVIHRVEAPVQRAARREARRKPRPEARKKARAEPSLEASANNNGFQKAERVLLYLLPIVGVLGFVVPLVLKQYHLTLLGEYLAFPLIVLPIAYLFYLRLRRPAAQYARG